MRASLREQARKCNHPQIFVVSSARALVLVFAICAIVSYRSSSCAAQTAPTKSESSQVPTSLAVQGAPWTGDFNEMLTRRYIRVLVASSKTQYYVVNGIQHGTSYEVMKAFEDWVNRKYPQKTKNLRLHVVFVPVSRDQFLPRLREGRGDLAVGAITITPERIKVVDFSQPMATDVKEIAVTGPHSPELHSLDDLSGQEVFVRKSSSYWEHLDGLNQKLQSEHKPPVKLRAAPEDLEDEDLLEMLNAGLVSVTITNAYLPRLWANIYTDVKSNPDVVLDSSGQVGWEMRKNSPQLMKVVNEFIATHKVGTAFGQQLDSTLRFE
jgi:membrane-bound lytic murein transglycosylase MltF